MIVVAYFFLLRPGEYTGLSSDTTPFALQDVTLRLGHRVLTTASSRADIMAATGASLTFTTQKNGVAGEVVAHGLSGHDLVCPVRALARQVLHLRSHRMPPTTPLASYVHNGRRRPVTPSHITDTLRVSVTMLGPTVGLVPADISARSLRAGGAMALLCAEVDTDFIRLLGRWQSDVMMRYLHLQAQPIMRGFARTMLRGGNYRLHRADATVPLH